MCLNIEKSVRFRMIVIVLRFMRELFRVRSVLDSTQKIEINLIKKEK